MLEFTAISGKLLDIAVILESIGIFYELSRLIIFKEGRGENSNCKSYKGLTPMKSQILTGIDINLIISIN